jgi:hypothetical protein
MIFIVREWSGRVRSLILAAWVFIVAVGLAAQTREMWTTYVVPNIARQHIQEDNVRAFLQTNDPVHILNKPWGEVPYPVGEVLLQRLQVPVIQNVLPPSVRRTIPQNPAAPKTLPPLLEASTRPVTLSTWDLPPSSTPFEWRSEPQPDSTLPVLRFRVAGDLGPGDSSARLVVRSAAGEVAIRPEEAPGNRWKTVSVFRPPGEWWLEATAPTRPAWFAVTEPVEVGRLTWLAEKLLKFHFVVIGLAVVLVVAGALTSKRSQPV